MVAGENTYFGSIGGDAANTLEVNFLFAMEEAMLVDKVHHNLPLLQAQRHPLVLLHIQVVGKDEVWVCDQVSLVVKQVTPVTAQSQLTQLQLQH